MSPPDLNSLPPSRSMASSPNQPRAMATAVSSSPDRHDSPSPRLSTSLAATASINAADLSRRSSASRGSPRQPRLPSERRRSQVAMTLSLADPTLPSPGELSSGSRRASQSYSSMSPSTLGGRGTIATGDPHHQRQPSLGDIHNELEQEQEAQVNRMLQMIREQQLQLDALRQSQGEHHSRRSSQQISTAPGNSGAVIDDLTPASERSISFPSIHPAIPAGQTAPRRISRNPSSANRSPALRPLPIHDSSTSSGIDWPPSPIESARRNSLRDESAYYQAETSALTRENQMLRARIRELEKQVNDLNSVPANTPATPSNLVTSPPLERQDDEANLAAAVASAGLAEKL